MFPVFPFEKTFGNRTWKNGDVLILELQGIILQFISRFLSAGLFKSKNSTPIPSKILESISYIQINLKANLTVGTLAKRANLHHDYFSRLFHQFTGERPLAYIHMKRIERAQYLIATTNLSFSQVAEETGFDNLPHFSRIFKKMTALSPGEYKKRNDLMYHIYQ